MNVSLRGGDTAGTDRTEGGPASTDGLAQERPLFSIAIDVGRIGLGERASAPIYTAATCATDTQRHDLAADLHRADLHGALLNRAELDGADLHRADLHDADLRSADQWADLRRCRPARSQPAERFARGRRPAPGRHGPTSLTRSFVAPVYGAPTCGMCAV